MSDLNNQIQNYSNNNFSNNTQNNRSPLVLRQSNREMLLNINPEVFQSSILNSINNFINNNRNNQNEQNQNNEQIQNFLRQQPLCRQQSNYAGAEFHQYD